MLRVSARSGELINSLSSANRMPFHDLRSSPGLPSIMFVGFLALVDAQDTFWVNQTNMALPPGPLSAEEP